MNAPFLPDVEFSLEIESLMKDGKLTPWNLPSLPYNETTILHWLRYHWGILEAARDDVSGSEASNNLHLIWLDLSEAIKKLPRRDGIGKPREGDAVDLLICGWPIYGKDNLGHKLGVHRWEIRELLQNAYKHIAEELA